MIDLTEMPSYLLHKHQSTAQSGLCRLLPHVVEFRTANQDPLCLARQDEAPQISQSLGLGFVSLWRPQDGQSLQPAAIAQHCHHAETSTGELWLDLHLKA